MIEEFGVPVWLRVVARMTRRHLRQSTGATRGGQRRRRPATPVIREPVDADMEKLNQAPSATTDSPNVGQDIRQSANLPDQRLSEVTPFSESPIVPAAPAVVPAVVTDVNDAPPASPDAMQPTQVESEQSEVALVIAPEEVPPTIQEELSALAAESEIGGAAAAHDLDDESTEPELSMLEPAEPAPSLPEPAVVDVAPPAPTGEEALLVQPTEGAVLPPSTISPAVGAALAIPYFDTSAAPPEAAESPVAEVAPPPEGAMASPMPVVPEVTEPVESVVHDTRTAELITPPEGLIASGAAEIGETAATALHSSPDSEPAVAPRDEEPAAPRATAPDSNADPSPIETFVSSAPPPPEIIDEPLKAAAPQDQSAVEKVLASTAASVLAPAVKDEYNRSEIDYRRPMPHPKVRGIVIDAHCHLLARRHAEPWFEAADHYGIDVFITMTPLEEAVTLQRDWGHRLRFIAVPKWGDSSARWADDWLQRIEAFYNLGSRIVKFHAAPGTMVMRGHRLDDPVFRPLFREVVDRGMAIMTHIGDPDTWYHGKYADTSKFGSRDDHYKMWADLLEEHRGHPWLGAHLGGNPEDLDRLQSLLDRFPDLMLDCSATRWMAREISARRDAAREFFIRNQDRILFGSDQVSGDDRTFDFFASRFWTHRKLWETAYIGPNPIIDPDLPKDQQPMLRGLALPDAVLQKLYHDNAVRFHGRIGSALPQ